MTTSKAMPTTGMISIYSGRECLGHVLARGRFGFEGFDVNDKSVGIYRTRSEAIDAVKEAARAKP
jgi:hypothetical protein